jgi:hypothetical protein
LLGIEVSHPCSSSAIGEPIGARGTSADPKRSSIVRKC